MTKRHTAEALRIAKAVRQKKYADGGGATYLFSDKWRDYLAKKGEQVASLPSEVANMASAAWQHPLSQAMRTSPGETSKAIGEYAYDLGKQGIDYASERPFSAARKAIDFATDWSMDPRVMVAKGIFSSTPANAGEDEFARQVQYGIRQAPEAEVPQYDNGGRTGYGGGGEVLAKALAALRNGNKVFPKPQRMFPEGARPPGGEYINAATGEAITGQKPARAVLGVTPEGKPVFMTDTEQVDVTGSPGKGSTKTMTNLYRKSAGWEWREAPEGYENIPMIVSTENRNKHYYSLGADYPKGVDLARYPNEASEPRLKPTTYGNVYPGEQVGTILNKKTRDEHPVYDMVTIRNLLAGTGVGAAGAATMPETEPSEYADGGRAGYADGGAPWADIYGNQSAQIFDQLQKDIAAQRNRPLPAIDPLRKNPITSPAPAYVKPNVGGDAPVSGDATGGTGDPFTSGGSDSGSSMDSSSSYGTPDGTPNGATFGSNTYGQTYGPTNTGIGMLDNAMNNPGTTAINAGFGLIGGPLGIANTVSGLVGGPTIGGMVTGSYSNPTSMSGTSYSKSSDPTAPAALAAHTAPAAPAEEESDPSAVSAPAVADASPESFGTGLTDGSIGGETGSFGAGPSGISGSAANDGTIGGETGSFGAGIGGFGGGFGDGSIGGETGSFGAGIGGGPDGGPDGGPSGGPDGGPAGDSGPGGDSGDGGSGSSGDGGGGDGGGSGGGDGGSEKRGGLVRSKRHASDSMVKRALKVTDAHGRKSKLRTKKDGSVVKQAVVLASKLAKRQRGRP